jgi:hypothetical protein
MRCVMAMVLSGVVFYALRLWYESIFPAWLAHILLNASLTLSYPLIVWFAPAF